MNKIAPYHYGPKTACVYAEWSRENADDADNITDTMYEIFSWYQDQKVNWNLLNWQVFVVTVIVM